MCDTNIQIDLFGLRCTGVKSRIKESTKLTKEATNMGKNQDNQRESNELIRQFLNGNENPVLGSKSLGNVISYLRGKQGVRVYYRIQDGIMTILGKLDKDKTRQRIVIDEILRLFGK